MEIVIGCKPSSKAFTPPPPRALSHASSSALSCASTSSQDLEDNRSTESQQTQSSSLAAGLGAGARGGEGRRCWHPSQDGALLEKIYSTMGVEVQVKPAQTEHREVEGEHGNTELGQLLPHGRPASEAQQMSQGPRPASITPAASEVRSSAAGVEAGSSADACLSVIRSHQATKLRSVEEVEESPWTPVRPSAQEAAAQEAAAQAEDADLMREIYNAMEAKVRRSEGSRPRWANADAMRKSSDLC